MVAQDILNNVYRQLEHSEYRGLYVLGQRSTSITVSQQQTRALNLVFSLIQSEELSHDGNDRIAIIGGGMAGITTAMALVSKGFHVTLFERSGHIFYRQLGCETRELHPNAHKWPSNDSISKATSLPFLNWDAGVASDVIKRLRNEWDRFLEYYATSNSIEVKLHRLAEVNLNSSSDHNIELSIFNVENKTKVSLPLEQFSHVFFAGGFGAEVGEENGFPSYWSGNSLGTTGGPVLVTGTSDGGLADVLKANIINYSLGDMISFFRHSKWSKVKSDLLLVETRALKNPAKSAEIILSGYQEIYKEIDQLILDEFFALSRKTNVILHGKGTRPFSLKSTIYNRFWCFLLWNGSQGLSYEYGPLELSDITSRGHDGKYEVKIENIIREFDIVTIRRGVVSDISFHNHTPLDPDFTDKGFWSKDFYDCPWNVRALGEYGLVDSTQRHFVCVMKRLSGDASFWEDYSELSRTSSGYEKAILELGCEAQSFTEGNKRNNFGEITKQLNNSLAGSFHALRHFAYLAGYSSTQSDLRHDFDIEKFCKNEDWQCQAQNPVKLFEVGLAFILEEDFLKWDEAWTKALKLHNEKCSKSILKLERTRLTVRHCLTSFLIGKSTKLDFRDLPVIELQSIQGDIAFLISILCVFQEKEGGKKLTVALQSAAEFHNKISPSTVTEVEDRLTQCINILKLR